MIFLLPQKKNNEGAIINHTYWESFMLFIIQNVKLDVPMSPLGLKIYVPTTY